MIFRRSRKVSFYSLILGTLSIFIVQSHQLILSSNFDLIRQPSLSNAVIDNYSTAIGSSSFDFVDQKLNKRFAKLISLNHNKLMKNFNRSFNLSLKEIFQWHSMDYFAWHTEDEYTWCVPVDINGWIRRIPVYKSASQTEHNLGSNVSLSEDNDHIDNTYLYGSFGTDEPINSYDWYNPRVFDFRDYVRENLICTKPDDRCAGFCNLIVKTQKLPVRYSSGRGKIIDLSSINGHLFGDSAYHDYYFPYSGEIHDWGSANVGVLFDYLCDQYLTLGTHSAFNCTLNNVWSKSVKYYVSRKTLLVLPNYWRQLPLADIPYLDVSKLFQLGSIGYDHKAKKYWYTVTFNQSLIRGVIGAYYNGDTSNLLYQDFSDKDKMIDFSKYKYWNDQNNGQAQYEASGKHSWVDPALLNFEEAKNYNNLIDHLYYFLKECVQDKTLTYDNYLTVKQKINSYVLKNHSFPTDEFIAHKLSDDPEWRDNGWANDAARYNLNSKSLDVLALTLPEIRFSQFSMFDTTGTGSANWSNLKQDWNIGTARYRQIWTSSFNDMLVGRNKIYLDTSKLRNEAPVNIMFNVGLLADAQTSSNFTYADNYATADDPISLSTYKPCNEENSETINEITNGNIQIKHDSFIEQTPGRNIVDFSYYQIKRNGEKIIPTNRLSDKGVIFRSSLMSKFPSEVWETAKKQNNNDVIKAIKSLFQDADGAPALPFCRADLWTNKLVDYNIPANKFQVQTDDASGTITFNLTDSLESVEISGLKQKIIPNPDPVPTPYPLPNPSPSPSSPSDNGIKSRVARNLESHGISLIIAISLLVTGCVATMLWIWSVMAKSRKGNRKIQLSNYEKYPEYRYRNYPEYRYRSYPEYRYRNYPEYYPRRFERRSYQPWRRLPPHRNQFNRNPKHKRTNFNQRKSNW